jgi:chromosome segregation ATPase
MKADWIIKALFAITIALVGVAYSGHDNRIVALESERKSLEQVARDAAVTAAVVKVEIATLKEAVETISVSLAAINDAMQRSDAAREILLARTAAMAAVMSNNRKDYQKALSDWSNANDALEAARKAKKN